MITGTVDTDGPFILGDRLQFGDVMTAPFLKVRQRL